MSENFKCFLIPFSKFFDIDLNIMNRNASKDNSNNKKLKLFPCLRLTHNLCTFSLKIASKSFHYAVFYASTEVLVS